MCTFVYPVIDMKRTGENIKKLREDRKISILEIQMFLGLTGPQAIYQWQKGITLPTVDNLCALSHLFGISMNDILVLKEPMRNGFLVDEDKVNRFTPPSNNFVMLMAA